MHITFQTILPFILAILLIFIIPMLAARNGMSYGQFVKSIFTGFTKKEYGPGERVIVARLNDELNLISETE